MKKHPLNSHQQLVFLAICTVTVRNIKADSDEHFGSSLRLFQTKADTFVALIAQSFESKDRGSTHAV